MSPTASDRERATGAASPTKAQGPITPIQRFADTVRMPDRPPRDAPASVLVLGAGPIIIGQACEFDYSGTQACRALREEGCRVSLVNSNPATIMTDPDMADATYIEPLDWETVAEVIAAERPEALLPTMGGQTALNCAMDLDRHGVLEKYGVRMIGASRESIDKAEDRARFREAMAHIGLETPRSLTAHNMDEAWAALDELGFPVVLRPSFTLGGSGGGIAYNREEFAETCRRGLALSPTSELQIDESLIGWKEMEMEVVRDRRDNCVVVCGIENVDPMGVHTGDSIAVAPIQTLTDKELQYMRDAAIAVLREIGVETGGSNVQFAICPETGRMVVVEMNPRVSRSSALASKATGFPIARVAAKLAIGYVLSDLRNEITDSMLPSSFEPSIDYVVTKLPRFDFPKFPGADSTLTTQMKSVGEVMGIGRCFQESLQKAVRGLETGVCGLESVLDPNAAEARARIAQAVQAPNPERLWQICDGLRAGMSVAELHALCRVDPWFLSQLAELVDAERTLAGRTLDAVSADELRELKRCGFSDRRLAALLEGASETQLRERRHAENLRPVFKRVDSCAAEFPVDAACMYATYEDECESRPSRRRKIIVLGNGPNRIGQGIEFDYCCVQAMLACKAHGREAIMINCNPETVSTDFDVSDRLYFESLTLEDTLAVAEVEDAEGIIVQFGGQTPLKLARALARAGVPIIGTSPDAIDRAEDRQRFQALLAQLGLAQLPCRAVTEAGQALDAAAEIGYPLMMRPSYVLGGQAMEIVRSPEELSRYMRRAVQASEDSPVLLDRFLSSAVEMDVDAVCDGERAVIGGLMQHIEQAGVHSGDSACSLPPYSLPQEIQDEARRIVRQLAMELNVIGLINVQLAVQDDTIYVLEVNPRASRTVPFVSKAIGVSLARIAASCMLGVSLAEQGFTAEPVPRFVSVKEAVFPFNKFLGVDPILGPEMKSTGEVMGIGLDFASAAAKSQRAAGAAPPTSAAGRKAFISVRDADKPRIGAVARELSELGFALVATAGTARVLSAAGLAVETVNKVKQGRPHIVDAIVNGDIALIVNTTEGRQSITDSATIRRSALDRGVYYTTTLAGAEATNLSMREGKLDTIIRIQDSRATRKGKRVGPHPNDSGRGERPARRAAPTQE